MKKIYSIAAVTFIEIARDKIFYSFLFFLMILLGGAYFASRLTILAPTRVVLDFGNTVLITGLSLYSILQGAAMIAKEYDKRTILLAQSKPLTPLQFIVGKFLGLAAVLFVNILILFVMETLILLPFQYTMGGSYYLSFVLAYLQALLLATVSIFCISFTTVTLSIIFVIGFWILGSTNTAFLALFMKMEASLIRDILVGVTYTFPSFEPFNLGYRLSYGFPVTRAQIFWPALYTLAYGSVFLYLSSKLIRKKEY